MPHIFEGVAAEVADASALLAENASLRDRLLRALAEAENARRQAERTAAEARQYSGSDFARQLLTCSTIYSERLPPPKTDRQARQRRRCCSTSASILRMPKRSRTCVKTRVVALTPERPLRSKSA
jgi:GrpE